ncbi:hypothetical protein BIW11_13033 [Tropilaelaps mercedesae]|uniref:Uncharacterized protein n=1 Tax=Tropilaelaps mercedesae TaxID=418985 RepID=A0A1V9X421_9ACAR|nr:hypothetical protein BIW11_13033 [Tropilaelaps mercedesae]
MNHHRSDGFPSGFRLVRSWGNNSAAPAPGRFGAEVCLFVLQLPYPVVVVCSFRTYWGAGRTKHGVRRQAIRRYWFVTAYGCVAVGVVAFTSASDRHESSSVGIVGDHLVAINLDESPPTRPPRRANNLPACLRHSVKKPRDLPSSTDAHRRGPSTKRHRSVGGIRPPRIEGSLELRDRTKEERPSRGLVT